jgi:ABC-type amino acid transport substrate-binding protein
MLIRKIMLLQWRHLLPAMLSLCICTGALAEPLKVCVSEDSPPQSNVHKGKATGFDIRLAQAVADAAGRELKIVPFETEFEKESTLSQEVNALLSSGLCDLVSGFPLLKTDLGPATRPNARVPDHPGAKRKRDRPFIALGELVASAPYQTNSFGVVQSPQQPPVNTLMDLKDRKPGAVTGTLAGTLISVYRQGMLRKQMVTLSQRENAWTALESGRVDSLLMPTSTYDAYKLLHADTPFTLAAVRRPIGLNLGFVTLTSAPSGLLEVTNQVIAQSMADGRMQQWAQQEGLSWSPPTSPAISNGPSLQSLMND